MSAFVLAQPGLRASVIVTSVSVTSPLFVTAMVKVTVPPVVTVCEAGNFVTVIAGWVGVGGVAGCVTVTGAMSLAVTSLPAGGWPVTVATLVNDAVRASVVQV